MQRLVMPISAGVSVKRKARRAVSRLVNADPAGRTDDRGSARALHTHGANQRGHLRPGVFQQDGGMFVHSRISDNDATPHRFWRAENHRCKG